MSFLVNLGLGLLFGLGLVISGMADPAKVLNFLDLFGTWDPSLAFVMGGAVIVAFFGYRLVLSRGSPVVGETFHLPNLAATFRPSAHLSVPHSSASVGSGRFLPDRPGRAVLRRDRQLVFIPAMIVGIVVGSPSLRWRLSLQRPQ